MNNRRFLPFIFWVSLHFLSLWASPPAYFFIGATERAIIFYKFGSGLDKENILQPAFT